MSERGEIKRDGTKAQKNSGRGQIQKGDAILGDYDFVIDYKESARSFTLNRAVWAKICLDAWHHGSEPALKVILGEGNEKVRLFVISEAMFQEMYEAWSEKYE